MTRLAPIALFLVLALVPASAALADGLPVEGVDASPLASPARARGHSLRHVAGGEGHGRCGGRPGRRAGGAALAVPPDRFTVPVVAYDGSASGLAADGRTLVLIRPRVAFPRRTTTRRPRDRAPTPGGRGHARETSASTQSRPTDAGSTSFSTLEARPVPLPRAALRPPARPNAPGADHRPARGRRRHARDTCHARPSPDGRFGTLYDEPASTPSSTRWTRRARRRAASTCTVSWASSSSERAPPRPLAGRRNARRCASSGAPVLSSTRGRRGHRARRAAPARDERRPAESRRCLPAAGLLEASCRRRAERRLAEAPAP